MKINFAAKTIEVTKTFANKASNFGSEEYYTLRAVMSDLPDFTVAIKMTLKPRRTYMKGLTYAELVKAFGDYTADKMTLDEWQLVPEIDETDENLWELDEELRSLNDDLSREDYKFFVSKYADEDEDE